MSEFNARTVTETAKLNSNEKNNQSSHESLDLEQQLNYSNQSKSLTVYQYQELNKIQLEEEILPQNNDEGMILRSCNRTNVHDVQQKNQDQSEDQVQSQNKLTNQNIFKSSYKKECSCKSVAKQKEFMTNRQSDNSQNLLSQLIEEEVESQISNNSLSVYRLKLYLSPEQSCQIQQPYHQENVDVSIKQDQESIRREEEIIQKGTQEFLINNRLEEQFQESPQIQTQPQKKNYPYKNLERSLFTYLKQFIKEKEKKKNKFKYFWRLKSQQVGKVKLIQLIYKQKQVLDFSLEFLTEKLWEQKAKVPKKIEQLKECNEYYLEMLKSCSSIKLAQAYLKKNKIQFTN